MTYAKKILIAADQFMNAMFDGWPDETLSSRAFRWEQNGVRKWPRIMIDCLFFWESEHCFQSYLSEREGRQLPPELR